MLGTSGFEYIFIRVCIFFLHNIALASVLYCIFLLLHPFLPPALYVPRAPYWIEAWLVAEAAFYTIIFLPYQYHLERPAIHPTPLSRKEREKLFERCNATVREPDKYLSRWFRGAKAEDIRRENVKEFIRWGFLNTGEVKEEDEDEIETYVDATEKMLGRDLPPGRGSAKSLRLTLDKVDCLHRSLLWYTCIGIVDTITHCSMLYNGFKLHRTALTRFFAVFPFRPLTLLSDYRSPVKHLTYWHRPHRSKTQLPVLFIHGIGVGLYPYTNFLRELDDTLNTGEGDAAEVGIIALEIMPICSRITHPALDKDVMVNEIKAIVTHHGWEKFTLVSHSYGSVISTHLLKSPLTAPLVGPIVLIDPVTFLLHLPDVAYNFTVRKPVRANEFQLWYFASKDIGVAHTLSRRFFWTENIMWKEDLETEETEDGKEGGGRSAMVVLSGRDIIVDAKAVKQYLKVSEDQQFTSTAAGNGTAGNGAVKRTTPTQDRKKKPSSKLQVLCFEHLDHAQVFDSEKTRRPVVETIRQFSAQG